MKVLSYSTGEDDNFHPRHSHFEVILEHLCGNVQEETGNSLLDFKKDLRAEDVLERVFGNMCEL